jgi:hypothetical protein
MMKHEWRKSEKQFYLPKDKPEQIIIPKFKFFTIRGEGNPNNEFFGKYIGVLYSLSYGIKMSPRQGITPDGYFEYTVYPLEGVWDISEEAKKKDISEFDKNTLVFNLMIRQPEFVTEEFAQDTISRVKKSKPHELLDKVKFELIEEGNCVQMMHAGSYDSEPASFARMEQFALEIGMKRSCLTHREIYITDARKVEVEKMRTLLRFTVD